MVLPPLTAVAAGTRQLQVVRVVRTAREMGVASCTDALLLTMEAMTVGSVAGQMARIRALGRGIQSGGATPWTPLFGNAFIHQLDGQRQKISMPACRWSRSAATRAVAQPRKGSGAEFPGLNRL